MGLSELLARTAARRAHVLLVEVPGQWSTRTAVERALVGRGWNLALSPADADVLAVCGRPGPALAGAVELVWEQLPGPRVRIVVASNDEAAARLDEAHDGLLDTERHREDARTRPGAVDLLADHGDMDHGDMDHGDMDQGDMDHGDMDHGDMDHGDMEMAPGGIPLAEGGEDRDGLEMDLLAVRLGPVLAHWPAGLVLRCALQGDVVVEASAEVLDAEVLDSGGGRAARGPELDAARCVDTAASLLALAGWDDAAWQARGVRDALLDGAPDAQRRLRSLASGVGRSRLLRRSLRDVRPLDRGYLAARELPTRWRGDTHDRLLALLERARSPSAAHSPGSVGVEDLAELVVGLDLATARLLVASLDLRHLGAEEPREQPVHG